MLTPEISEQEAVRLAALYRVLALDKSPIKRYQLIVDYAALEFNVPICLITFVSLEYQWFHAKKGIAVSEILRAISFCGHAILGQETFVVNDTLKDERFFDNPLVLGSPFIRAYAGAPILLDGLGIGTLCIMDIRARYFTEVEIFLLEKLRDVITKELGIF